YWQCAFVIPKGSADELMKRDIGDFRKMIMELSPWLGSRVDELRGWDAVKLLAVAVDRLPLWYRPGLLCIGDAAHAMSPIGGGGAGKVADGRRGDQSRGAGCRGGGKYPRRAAAQRHCDDRSPAARAGPPRMADAGDPAHPDRRSEPHHWSGVGEHFPTEAAGRREAPEPVPGPATPSGSPYRDRRAPPTHPPAPDH